MQRSANGRHRRAEQGAIVQVYQPKEPRRASLVLGTRPPRELVKLTALASSLRSAAQVIPPNQDFTITMAIKNVSSSLACSLDTAASQAACSAPPGTRADLGLACDCSPPTQLQTGNFVRLSPCLEKEGRADS